MTRFLIVLAVLVAVGGLAPSAKAEEKREPRAFETQTVVRAGGPIGFAFTPASERPEMQPMTVSFAQRFRSPKYSNFGLEAGVVLPNGAGVNLLLDAIRTENFRLHIADPGIFRNVEQEWGVSVSRLPRKWDLTFGSGADLQLCKGLWLTIDWRVFMPDPLKLKKDYVHLAGPFKRDAVKGGQAWLGLAATW